MSGSTFKKLTGTHITIKWTNNRVCRFTNTFNISATGTDRFKMHRSELRTAIGGTGDEHECDGIDVVETNNLREKTVNLVSDS